MIIEQKMRDVALIVDDSPETLRLLTDALDGAAAMRIVDQITSSSIIASAAKPSMPAKERKNGLLRFARNDGLTIQPTDIRDQYRPRHRLGDVKPVAVAATDRDIGAALAGAGFDARDAFAIG